MALPDDDPRRTVAAATQTLADVLDRRVETIVLGHDASVRVGAVPAAGGVPATTRLAVVPAAAVAPDEPDDVVVDGVLVWSTVPSDRHRLRDRLRELRIAPWADVAGEGIALRMAAARAALGRLVEHTSGADWSTAPDLVVTSGGVWSTRAGPDRHAGHSSMSSGARARASTRSTIDRLLGMLGAIPDPGERRLIMTDLADDLLAPLGSVVTPAGLRAGRSAGSLVVHAGGRRDGARSGPGWPGAGRPRARRDRGRRVPLPRHRAARRRADVTSPSTSAVASAGLLVDLRDVPLRLPDRADRRRDLLAAWQAGLWAGGDA